MRDAGLRFGVGERVEVVALSPHPNQSPSPTPNPTPNPNPNPNPDPNPNLYEVARALDDGSHVWAAGRVVALRYHNPKPNPTPNAKPKPKPNPKPNPNPHQVALRYHEPRFGEGVTMPYQVKLDADARLIFVREDTAAP